MHRMIRISWMMGIVLLSLLFGFSSAVPQIYRWTDEKGTVHFSDSPSTLPRDYSIDKKRDAEKKGTVPNEKAKSEKESIVPSRAPKPAEAIGVAPAQPPEPTPPEPVKPTGQGMVFGQVKAAGENAPKQSAPGEKALGTQEIEFGTEPQSPSAIPGGPAEMFGMKNTYKIGVYVGILGIIISVVGGIWFLVAAFKVSIGWGIACLFLPFVQLIFLFVHWKEARKPFAVGVLSMGVLFVAAFLMVEKPFLLLRHYTQ